MNENILLLLIGALVIIAAVIAYNMYQETRFRNKIRSQFGGAQEDALLNTSKNQVRDGENELLRPTIIGESNNHFQQPQTLKQTPLDHEYDPLMEEQDEVLESVLNQEITNNAQEFVFEDESENIPTPHIKETAIEVNEEAASKGNWLIDLDGLSKLELPWFDKRIDYTAYISLSSLQELLTVPRLSNRKRYRIAGCTSNNRFQEAEAIPGVQYQAFVLGLQSIDRNGLATEEELNQFKEHASIFAKQMNGGIKFSSIPNFLANAAPIDTLCEEVDKVIAIHLVSRSSVLGSELRPAVERLGFELEHDGSFYYYDNSGCPLFTIVTLDGTPFTAPLLAKQAYRGFSILFSVALVKDGEKSFNQFMDFAVKLSSQLHLDLVDDKRQELSTQWLKEIREYVIFEQQKMMQAKIPPGEELAQRLFS